jgi:hypothetical protein
MLAVVVKLNTEEFSSYFKTALKENCKNYIPSAQSFYIINNFVAQAIPGKFSVPFESKGIQYEFTFFWK